MQDILWAFFSYSPRAGQSPEERATIHTIFPPHTSLHYRNAGQISDIAGKCGLCVSLGCEEQLTDLQEVQLHFKNDCGVTVRLESVECMNEVEVNRNHTHISRKLHGQVGNFFLGGFQLSPQLADLLRTKRWTTAGLPNSSTNKAISTGAINYKNAKRWQENQQTNKKCMQSDSKNNTQNSVFS